MFNICNMRHQVISLRLTGVLCCSSLEKKKKNGRLRNVGPILKDRTVCQRIKFTASSAFVMFSFLFIQTISAIVKESFFFSAHCVQFPIRLKTVHLSNWR